MKKKIQVIIKNSNFQQQKKGTIINVFPGYAFNYLIPNGIVAVATKNQIKHYQMFLDIEKKKQEENSIQTEKIKNKIEKISKITVYRKQGDNKLIFGSIKEKDIIKWISRYCNLQIDKKQIKVDNINNIEINGIKIHIKQNIIVTVKLCIIPCSI
uniref:50S ribosomal protein L9, chloroplastic n=1 Tax=Palisada sp. TaxID=1955416 RepID=A0A1Z1MRS2_9FLOR|nr:ribosomal protein L9 [Palisada sp.]